MINEKKLTVSHAPFWHDGSNISTRSYNIMIAALPAVLFGLHQYGIPAAGVVALSISSAILWELLMNVVMKRDISTGDGNAALIGILFAMLIPATSPWWLVITGTFFAVVIGKQIYGGIGSNPFNPVVLSVTILMVAWGSFFDFDNALKNYEFGFQMAYPLGVIKHAAKNPDLFNFPDIANSFNVLDMFMGKQIGGAGSTFGLGIVIGGIYLILRGIIRWEIPVSFLAGIFITALIFNMTDPSKYASPAFHIVTGYTLIGAFFLATEDSSSPVNFLPMLIYGAGAGIMTVLIRNIGVYIDGVVFGILLMNLINPILDKIRPKALGKG